MPYKQFVFKEYDWDVNQKTLSLHYSYDDALHFTETYRFDFEFIADINQKALHKAFQLLSLVAGVSYYKAYLPPEISAKSANIDDSVKTFLEKTYQNGLGEFFYVNNLDACTVINFPINLVEETRTDIANNEGLLIGLGGGKDSLVSVEFLRDQPKVATWSLNHRTQLEPLVERVGLPHFWVERKWDTQLLELNKLDAYNGHIPISAIFACVGVVVAILSGYRDVVVSNESSANEPTLQYQGVDINHQYSKSMTFEQDFQTILAHLLGRSIRYYSFLRPLTEVHIAKLFAGNGFDRYQDVFSSCNRAFTHDNRRLFWDGSCPKCAFVFLALTPFVERAKLERLFSGKNLLLDPKLEPIYRQLLGIEGHKPLECIGEVKESRAAMQIAQDKYPELKKYIFELPTEYNYQSLSPHAMPQEIYNVLLSKL